MELTTLPVKFRVNGWVIIGVHGLYVGWHYTRKDMINQHCSDLGRTWKQCRAKGDRCIKVTLSNGWRINQIAPKLK